MIYVSTKIVIDTSIFISALISPSGPNREVLRRCFLGTYQPLMGNALFCEYEALMSRTEILERCPFDPSERVALLHALVNICEWVSVYYLWRPNLKDATDNHLMELAVAGGASIIVTNNLRGFRDAELLFPDIWVCRPQDLLMQEM